MTKFIHKISPKILITAITTAVMALISPITTYAVGPIEAGVQAARTPGQPENLFGIGGVFTTVSNTLLFVIGALSVVMIIVGGIRYVISGGKEANVTKAKNTILYAIIGLVVALLAYAMINFVLDTLIPGINTGGTNV